MQQMNPEFIEQIWKAAQPVEGYNAKLYRKDQYGAWMKRDFLNQQSIYAWKIAYVQGFPVAVQKDNEDAAKEQLDFATMSSLHQYNIPMDRSTIALPEEKKVELV